MELTRGEAERIRAAYQKTAELAAWEALADRKARDERKPVEKLAKVWFGLSEDERMAVATELRELAALDIDPHDLEVGVAALRVAEAGRGSAGAPVRLPGLREAALEAVAVWQDRHPGQPVEVGQFRRETRMHHPYPLLDFVSDAMEQVLNAREIATATAMVRPERIDLLRAVDSHLRALRQSGAI